MDRVAEVMNMLDWNNSEEVQEKGRKLAGEMERIDVFLQPVCDAYDKNVWDNCAKILSQKTDEELAPYLIELFEWLQDMNWPGACCILGRMVEYEKGEVFVTAFEKCMNQAIFSEDDIWVENLLQIENLKGRRL